MKLGFLVRPAIAVAFLLPTSAIAITPSWSYVHPKVAAGEFSVHSACVMPAEGKLSKLGMKGREGMSKESDVWSTAIQNVAENHLKLAGVGLVPALDASGGSASDDELRQVVLRLQTKYDGIADKINKRPKDIGKSRFSLGDDVALLPCAAKSDVLVFVEGHGQVLTGGKKAFGLLVAGPSSSAAFLVLSMADAKTGEILAFVRMVNGGKFMDDAEKAYGKALDKQFKKMKIGSTPTGKKKK